MNPKYLVALGCGAGGLLTSQANAQLVAFDYELERSETQAGAPQLVRHSYNGFMEEDDPLFIGESFHYDDLWQSNLQNDYPYGLGDLAGYGSLWVWGNDYSQSAEIDPENHEFNPENIAFWTDQGTVLVPAQAAFSASGVTNIETVDDLTNILIDGGDPFSGFDEFSSLYSDSCNVVLPNTNFRQATGDGSVVFGLCDSADLNLSLDGVGLNVLGDENSVNLRFIMSDLGIDFTADESLRNNYGQFSRSDAWSQFGDYLETSGKMAPLINALIGESEDFNFTKGMLPKGSDLFSFSATIERSAVATPASTNSPNNFEAGTYELSLGVDSFGQLIGYVLGNDGVTAADFGLEGFNDIISDCYLGDGGTVVGACDGLDVTLSVLGVEVSMQAAENDTDLSIYSRLLDLDFETVDAFDQEASLDEIEAYVEANVTQAKLLQALQEAQIAETPNSPIAGTPQSLQGSFSSSIFTLDQPSDLLDENSDSTDSSVQRGGRGGAWMGGGRVGSFEVGEEDGHFIDITAERGFRLSEGSRDRLKVSVPFSYFDYGDDLTQSTGSVRIGYEKSVIDRKWVVEPSVGLGYAFETDKLAAGAMWYAGLSSRYKIAPVGKGHIVIGNGVGYTQSIDIESDDKFQSADVSNVAIRNGIAYQLPVGQRIFDRTGTLRTSYAYTFLEGDELFLDNYHEVNVSYGVGSAETTTRHVIETFRLGAGATFGDDYTSWNFTAGFRF